MHCGDNVSMVITLEIMVPWFTWTTGALQSAGHIVGAQHTRVSIPMSMTCYVRYGPWTTDII